MFLKNFGRHNATNCSWKSLGVLTKAKSCQKLSKKQNSCPKTLKVASAKEANELRPLYTVYIIQRFYIYNQLLNKLYKIS